MSYNNTFQYKPMKSLSYLFFTVFILLMFYRCKKHPDDDVISSNLYDDTSDITILDVPEIETPELDWENIQGITLSNSQYALLPWIGSSSTNIPNFILSDVSKEDGWELLYNLSHTPGQLDQDYLIFYNKFTGIIRSFYHLNTLVSEGTNGYWGLELEGTSSLLNNVGYFAEPINSPRTDPYSITSNISTLDEAKYITRGWNAFETEITYDPSPVTSSVSMRILSYDQNIQNVNLSGGVELGSEGTIITTNSKNPAQTFVNNAAKAGGSAAKAWVDEAVGDGVSKPIKVAAGVASAIVSGGVTEIIKAGVNLLFGSFIGKQSTTTNTTQKIEFKTNGTLTINGVITSSTGNNVKSANKLWVPGTVWKNEYYVKPYYKEKLGVWNLKKAPVVNIRRKAYYGGEYNHDTSLYSRSATISNSDIEVEINPVVMSEISDYTVETHLFHYSKFQGKTNWNGGTLSFVEAAGRERFNDGETIIYSNFQETFAGPKAVFLPPGELMEMPNIVVNSVDPRYVVKVTVTLFPKTGYDQDPIVITRSYLPDYEIVD